MTYLKDGAEHLTGIERKVYDSIGALSAAGRTANNSQIAADSGYSRTMVASATQTLRMRGYIRDVSKGASYHWRPTGKQAVCGDRQQSHGYVCVMGPGHEAALHHDADGRGWLGQPG